MKRPHLIVDDSEITEALVNQIAESINISDGAGQQQLKEKLLTVLDLARTVTTLGASGSKTLRQLAFDKIVRAAAKVEDRFASTPLNRKAAAKAIASLIAAIGPECEETPQGTEQHRVRAILQWQYVAAGRQNPRSAANHTTEEKQVFDQAVELIMTINLQQSELHTLQAVVDRIKNAAIIAQAQAKTEEKASPSERHKPDYAKQAIVRQLKDDYEELTGTPVRFSTMKDGRFTGPAFPFFEAVLPLVGYPMSRAAIRKVIQDLPSEA